MPKVWKLLWNRAVFHVKQISYCKHLSVLYVVYSLFMMQKSHSIKQNQLLFWPHYQILLTRFELLTVVTSTTQFFRKLCYIILFHQDTMGNFSHSNVKKGNLTKLFKIAFWKEEEHYLQYFCVIFCSYNPLFYSKTAGH